MSRTVKQIVNLLKIKGISLSVAESCTGGMLAEVITSVSGASKVFKFGIITYSNNSKIKFLRVPKKIITKYGSVSKECCDSMVKSLSRISKAKLNIAITGIAGPLGSTKIKPVGLVYIGVKLRNKIKINKYLFKNKGRAYIRKKSVEKSLKLIEDFL